MTFLEEKELVFRMRTARYGDRKHTQPSMGMRCDSKGTNTFCRSNKYFQVLIPLEL
jgi:hypothetical protein